MHESPRLRRLRNDLAALERLRDESSVLKFRATGRPAQQYVIEFLGKSLARHRGKVSISERHQIEIKLGASYPRTMPEIRWMTPIYHPNISEIGMVCLGGYGTHWVPSLNLEELVGMLWDMARYHNYDVRSPYNRDAALWVAGQTAFPFPLDHRPLRDLRARLGRVDIEYVRSAEPAPATLLQKLFDFRRRPGALHSRDAGTVFSVSSSGEIEPVVLEPVNPTAGPTEPEATNLTPTATPGAGHEGLILLEEPVAERSEGNEGEGNDPVNLIILEEPVTSSVPPSEPDRAVRLRAQDEEILFIE